MMHLGGPPVQVAAGRRRRSETFAEGVKPGLPPAGQIQVLGAATISGTKSEAIGASATR
jgi:hypothetical protein